MPHINHGRAVLICAMFTFLSSPANAESAQYQEQYAGETPSYWYESGRQELKTALAKRQNKKRARNIILFVGDGMGISTVTAGRIYDGQSRGQSGEESRLSFEAFPAVGLAKTYNTNQQTSDSAGTMTAMMSGIKTEAGFIGVDATAKRGDCASVATAIAPTFLQQAALAGKATGIVSTATITHATPAATYAHVPERNWQSDADMPAAALAAGCRDIARQLIELNSGGGINVALGGGISNFLPKEQTDPLSRSPGARNDGRDLTREWLTSHTDSAFVWNREQLASVDKKRTRYLLGLFNPSHLSYSYDRRDQTASEPGLVEMTAAAIDILKEDRDGFFLMVEAGRIDHGHHYGNALRALGDTQELSQAVQVALDKTDARDTLIIVTADHSHTFTLAGYPTRGNPILGKVISNDASGNPAQQPAKALDGMPYTTVGYINGPGALDHTTGTRGAGRRDLTTIDTTAPEYFQEALVPGYTETHAAEDVPIYAIGPWSHLFHTTHEQHYIYHVMRHAAGL